MTPQDGTDEKSAPDIDAILNQMWVRFLPDFYERVAVLEAAGRDRAAGNLTAEGRAAAHSAAHKLAGSLGTFGLMRGTELAREFERACANETACAAIEPSRLQVIADQIRTIISQRK